MKKITYIDHASINNKRVLLRVDYNVSVNADRSIADDIRITQSLPTIKQILPQNKLILVSHLDRPKKRDPKLSLKIVVERLKEYLPKTKITLIDDFLTEDKKTFENQQNGEILVLENIRFYKEEQTDDLDFAKKLASLADVYVNDAFSVSHRAAASIVGVPLFIPSYGGLLLRDEVESMLRAIRKPKKPLVVIIGGAKISDKINLINKLTEIADYLLIGGGMANTFLSAQGYNMQNSLVEHEQVEKARQLLFLAAQKNTAIILPEDGLIGNPKDTETSGKICKSDEVPKGGSLLDIGPETKAKFGSFIAKAKTIIWNGPMGFFENHAYRQGTDFIYYSIAHNNEAMSIVGGGDTLAAIKKKEYLDKITHISTGGGAMLELIEKGTLPGIDALKR